MTTRRVAGVLSLNEKSVTKTTNNASHGISNETAALIYEINQGQTGEAKEWEPPSFPEHVLNFE